MKNVDRKLALLSHKINFYEINPVNVQKEKSLFLSHKDYNPQFKYKKVNLESVREELLKLKPDNSVIGKLLKQKIEQELIMVDMLENRGNPSFTGHSVKLYGTPSKELIKKAEKFIDISPMPKLCQYTSTQTIAILRKIISNLGINWHVKTKDMLALAAVSVQDKILYVKKDYCFSDHYIKHVTVHEIGTHILRAVNALKQPYKLFLIGFPSYLRTEEGLAMMNDELNKTMDSGLLQSYATRVIAVSKSQELSFRVVFDYLNKFFDDDKAFRITTRAKRGMSDTGEPGGLTKDYLYLQGYFDVKNYIAKHKNTDKLYYGKIGIEHIPLLDKIEGVVEPRFL